MKCISHMSLLLAMTTLLILIITTNASIQLFSQNLVLATAEQQQEDASSSSNENGDSPGENESPETSEESTDSEKNNEDVNNNDNGNDFSSSSSGQSNECPDTNDLLNVPTYIDQDGCKYPCPAPGTINPSNISEECSSESPSSEATPSFSINEERPIQPPQNIQSIPSQNTLTGPKIDSDSTITNIPNTQTNTTTLKSFNPSSQYKPGSGQTELSIPGKSDSLARPFTPGAGNTQVEGIPSQPNINPQTPIDPGKIITTIPDKAYLTVITKMMNFYTGFLKVSDFEICVQSTIQTDGNSRTVDAIPRCADGSSSGVQYTVQAPGSITIWVDNLDELGVQSLMIETPNLSNYINAHESKTSTIYISPYQS